MIKNIISKFFFVKYICKKETQNALYSVCLLNVNGMSRLLLIKAKCVVFLHISHSRDRLVVRTLRCGRSNPGSNPGHGNVSLHCHGGSYFFFLFLFNLIK